MATARRWYFYGVAFVSQLMLYGGVVGLLRETLGFGLRHRQSLALSGHAAGRSAESIRFTGGLHSARSGAAQTSAVHRCARHTFTVCRLLRRSSPSISLRNLLSGLFAASTLSQ